jgi:predicted dehydrogenase
VRWGLLSTASIGRLVVEATRRSEAARFVAVASRDGDRARQFAENFDLERALFDVGLDLPRRDELELIGTEGKIVVSDPWLCRATTIELCRDGRGEQLPVDPEGTYALAHDDYDVYRIELDAISGAIAEGVELPFGRADAIDQARALQALIHSSEIAAPVDLSSRCS